MNQYLIIGISVLTIGLTVQTYRAHNLSNENRTLSDQVSYTHGYIEKSQRLEAENKAMTAQLTAQLENVKDDEKCMAPPAVRNVIGSLPR